MIGKKRDNPISSSSDGTEAIDQNSSLSILFDGQKDPFGFPIPETTFAANPEAEDPLSDDAVGSQDIVRFSDGMLLLAHGRYHSSYVGHGKFPRYKEKYRVEIKCSVDGGRSWEFVSVIPGQESCSDHVPCLVRPPDAHADFVRIFVERFTDRETHIVTFSSHNRGRTWEGPDVVWQPTNNGRFYSHAFNGIKVLPDGTWLMPMQILEGKNIDNGKFRAFLNPILAFCKPADDPEHRGEDKSHWKLYEVPLDLPPFIISSPNAIFLESDAVVRPDGSIYLILRSSCGWVFEAESFDAGKTWSKLCRSILPNPNSQHYLLMLKDGTLAMACHDCDRNSRKLVRSPLSISFSRDLGKSWKRTIAVASKPDWHHAYAHGLELGDGTLILATRHGHDHDAHQIACTRVHPDFVKSARINLDCEGAVFHQGRIDIASPLACLSGSDRQEFKYPITAKIRFIVKELTCYYHLISLVGEGCIDVGAVRVRRNKNSYWLDVFALSPTTGTVGWLNTSSRITLNQEHDIAITIENPYSFIVEIDNIQIAGPDASKKFLTSKPMACYTSRIGSYVREHEKRARAGKVRIEILKWTISNGDEPFCLRGQWDKAISLHRFLTKHFSFDENGPFHGRIPEIGVSLSIPQGRWGGFDPDSRNLTYVECNLNGDNGRLVIDRAFLNKTGTLAAWMQIKPHLGDKQGYLLSTEYISVGYEVSQDYITPFLQIGGHREKIAPFLANQLGLFAWRWGVDDSGMTHSFFWKPLNEDIKELGSFKTSNGVGKITPPIIIFNDESCRNPFRGCVFCLAVWNQNLEIEELNMLERC